MEDCYHDAVLLAGLIDAIDILRSESSSDFASNAATAVQDAARERAHKLADDMDRAMMQAHRPAVA